MPAINWRLQTAKFATRNARTRAIADLANLGPKSEAMLRRAGITTVKQLQAIGPVRAYAKVERCGAKPSLNLLWALEGALANRPWRQVAKTERLSLLLQLEELKSGHRSRADMKVARTRRESPSGLDGRASARRTAPR